MPIKAGNCVQRVGLLKGMNELPANKPALPPEVPAPGPIESYKLTCQPRIRRAQAHETPTMPAPKTATVRGLDGSLGEVVMD